mmetsp:Transcript_67764/g.198307  ORF Transcript_67764/g.198307 Transcript_67764/m.198307 type:complete len:223 (-) Transcript_67764:142-810(-)
MTPRSPSARCPRSPSARSTGTRDQHLSQLPATAQGPVWAPGLAAPASEQVPAGAHSLRSRAAAARCASAGRPGRSTSAAARAAPRAPPAAGSTACSTASRRPPCRAVAARLVALQRATRPPQRRHAAAPAAALAPRRRRPAAAGCHASSRAECQCPRCSLRKVMNRKRESPNSAAQWPPAAHRPAPPTTAGSPAAWLIPPGWAPRPPARRGPPRPPTAAPHH